ncbi:MAG: acyltransferase [Promethearchaeota archaeon]
MSSLLLILIRIIFKPKEGEFKRNPKDRNYLFWNIRNLVKKWPLYIMASNPFPWLKHRFNLRFFGVKIGKNCICDNCWISSEFITIGKNCIIGVSSVIVSFGMDAETFLLRKIIIEDNVALGAKSVILPGTVIKRGAKLSAFSSTNYNDILEEDLVYNGNPAKITGTTNSI